MHETDHVACLDSVLGTVAARVANCRAFGPKGVCIVQLNFGFSDLVKNDCPNRFRRN